LLARGRLEAWVVSSLLLTGVLNFKGGAMDMEIPHTILVEERLELGTSG